MGPPFGAPFWDPDGALKTRILFDRSNKLVYNNGFVAVAVAVVVCGYCPIETHTHKYAHTKRYNQTNAKANGQSKGMGRNGQTNALGRAEGAHLGIPSGFNEIKTSNKR